MSYSSGSTRCRRCRTLLVATGGPSRTLLFATGREIRGLGHGRSPEMKAATSVCATQLARCMSQPEFQPAGRRHVGHSHLQSGMCCILLIRFTV